MTIGGRTLRGWITSAVCGVKGHDWLYWGGGLMYCARCIERRRATDYELDEHEHDPLVRATVKEYGPTG